MLMNFFRFLTGSDRGVWYEPSETTVDVPIPPSGCRALFARPVGWFGRDSTGAIMHVVAAISVTKVANYLATTSDFLILGDATAGIITITLPPAASVKDKIYVVKKIAPVAAVSTVVVAASGAETIDGAGTAVLRARYESIMVQSDGTSWWII